MKTQNNRWLALASMCVGLAMSGSAHAVWTFETGTPTSLKNYVACTPNASGCSAVGTVTAGTTVDTTTVGLTGFAVQNAGYKETYVGSPQVLTQSGGTSGGFNTAAVISDGKTTNPGTFTQSGNWAAKSLTSYGNGGQGMTAGLNDGATPNHAIDNNGYTESVLLSFSASTVLSSIGLGYTNGSTSVDISVFRWVGTTPQNATQAPNLAGTAAATMAGWELVGNYGDLIEDISSPYNVVNTVGKTSSWWLISAYNSGFAQSAGAETRGLPLTNGDDYFKLLAAAGTTCTKAIDSKGVCGGTSLKVPEPASLALTSVALLGVAGLRRRKAKMAA